MGKRRNRRRRWTWLFLLLPGAYLAYPYLTLLAFQQALEKKDSAALERMVDFPAVRASLRSQLVSEEALPPPSEEESLLGRFGRALEGLANRTKDHFITTLITPEGFPKLYRISQKGVLQPQVEKAFFVSPTRFQVIVDGTTTWMTWERGRWRITDMKVPERYR
ncbi:MAG: DUF2939 domain-containing protein [Verrucomicrobiota bacterium]